MAGRITSGSPTNHPEQRNPRFRLNERIALGNICGRKSSKSHVTRLRRGRWRAKRSMRSPVVRFSAQNSCCKLGRSGFGAWQVWRNTQVFGAPATHSLHDWDKFLAGIAQHVIHMWRHALCRESAKNAVVLQFTKLSSQHLFTHAWQRSRISAKRRDPNPRCQTISTFHFPARTFEVACTGHPKWFFIGLLPGLQNCAYFSDCQRWPIFEDRTVLHELSCWQA